MLCPVSLLIHGCGTCSQCDMNFDSLVIFNHVLFLLTSLLCCLILLCVTHLVPVYCIFVFLKIENLSDSLRLKKFEYG